MNNKTFRDHISQQCGFNKAKPYKATQVCNAGDWPEHLPESFEDWLRSNNDTIEIAMPLDRTEATTQWFDNKAKTERHPFQ